MKNNIKSDRRIYQVIHAQLHGAVEPMTANELMDVEDIKNEALAEFGGQSRDIRTATDKLSDALGFMWRKGLLTRYPAPRTSKSFARYAYSWANNNDDPFPAPLRPKVRYTGKQAITITETQDGAEIEFEKLVVSIRFKS